MLFRSLLIPTILGLCISEQLTINARCYIIVLLSEGDKMSVRSDIADRFANAFNANRLNDSYGVSVGKGGGDRYYTVTFCKARVLDGVVNVYGPKFILVKWMTQFRDMPHKGQEKFESEGDALKFIQDYFVR